MHYIHIGLAPKYLSVCVSAASGRYRLSSTGSAAYFLPRTRTKFGVRGFSFGPAAPNTLPSDLHDITDTSTFRKRLKNVLFDRAYNWLLLALLDESYSGAVQISRWFCICFCQTREEKSVPIFIPYERTFNLVFWEKEWLVGVVVVVVVVVSTFVKRTISKISH